jgi:hypothetical protein
MKLKIEMLQTKNKDNNKININNCWDITKLILSQKKNFNVPKNFVSDYYNIETINIFENFFDDIIIDKVEKFELTETQSKLLELHKPKDKELSLRDKVSSTEVIILLPCPYVSSSINLCDHYEDFKSSANLANHLINKHHLNKKQVIQISKEIYEFSLEKYQKNSLLNNISVLTNFETKFFKKKIQPELVDDNEILFENKKTNNEIETQTQNFENKKTNNETQTQNFQIKKKKIYKKRKHSELKTIDTKCLNCEKEAPMKCDLLF